MKPFASGIALVALTFCLPAPAAAQPRETSAPPSEYVVGVEDVILISVWREPQLSMSVIVRPDGKITFPLVGDVQAAGRTPRQVSETLSEALARYIKEPIVTATVTEVNNFKVYVLGEVNSQGELVLKRRTRLLQAIALAGGLTAYADRSNVILVRDENGREARTQIDYRRVVSGDRPELNVYLKPGDTIIVN